MRSTVALCFAVAVAGLAQGRQDRPYTPWPLYNKGVRWEKSLDEAREAARKERKLVLYYLNTGDVDKDETS